MYDGELKVVGNTVDLTESDQARLNLSEAPEVSYELLCRRHWLAGEPTAETNANANANANAMEAATMRNASA